jgi:hypothetical protein
MKRFIRYHDLTPSSILAAFASRPTVEQRWRSLLTKLNDKHHFSGVSALFLPDVSNMKVKKVQVKNKGALR